jgi:hypothetical protein
MTTTLLLIAAQYKPTGHVVEALKWAKGYADANEDIRIHLLLHAESPVELALACPWIERAYAVSVDEVAREGAGAACLNAIPRTWDYVVSSFRFRETSIRARKPRHRRFGLSARGSSRVGTDPVSPQTFPPSMPLTSSAPRSSLTRSMLRSGFRSPATLARSRRLCFARASESASCRPDQSGQTARPSAGGRASVVLFSRHFQMQRCTSPESPRIWSIGSFGA